MTEQKFITTSTGFKIPTMLYGTAWKKARTDDYVAQALQAGFRGIDTACQPKHYDERLVGVGIKRMQEQGVEREALYLQTKFTPLSSQDPEQIPYDKSAPIDLQVAQSFETSQANLQTDYVDCLLLHSPLDSHAQTMQAWRALEQIYHAGGTRQLGISNCYDVEVMKSLYAEATVKPVVVQNRFCQENGYQVEMRDWCSQHGTIFQSFWSLTANQDLLTSDTVKRLAEKHQQTPAQIFFRFLSHSGIIPLSGTTSVQHMQDDLSIFAFELAGDDIKSMELLLK